MAVWTYTSYIRFDGQAGNVLVSQSNDGGTLDDGDPVPDMAFSGGEAVSGGPNAFLNYSGQATIDGELMPVFFSTQTLDFYAFSLRDQGDVTAPAVMPMLNNSDFLTCFAEGTQIATPTGYTAVENLAIGQPLVAADGGTACVRWLGRQTRLTRFSGSRNLLVRIRAGALGGGLPHSNLTVTADHGMVLDGHVVNASALVNGVTIDFVPMAELPDAFTVYHIETEAHDVILANGAPSETFIDAAGRRAFDNYDECLGLFGAERIIPEMKMPRITSARLLPDALASRLGVRQTDAFAKVG